MEKKTLGARTYYRVFPGTAIVITGRHVTVIPGAPLVIPGLIRDPSLKAAATSMLFGPRIEPGVTSEVIPNLIWDPLLRAVITLKKRHPGSKPGMTVKWYLEMTGTLKVVLNMYQRQYHCRSYY